jgi:WD40 repeat protein
VEKPHQGTVTALHYTPQARLVSASRDNTVRVWTLGKKRVALERTVANRGGTVGDLGVTQDGGLMLFDRGKRLQVLSVKDGGVHNEVQNTFGAAPFETLAKFSPDGKLLLTAGAPEGKLLLWKAPTGEGRAYEVRQFATIDRSPVTCAAFAPAAGNPVPYSTLAVSGTRDGRLYLWELPDEKTVNEHRITGLKLTQVEPVLDASTRQFRISVDVNNPVDRTRLSGYRLTPGAPVTVVIE